MFAGAKVQKKVQVTCDTQTFLFKIRGQYYFFTCDVMSLTVYLFVSDAIS